MACVSSSAVGAANCAIRARGLTGEAGRAYQEVQAGLESCQGAVRCGESSDFFELSLTAADLAERLGSNAAAAAHYRLALAIAPRERFCAERVCGLPVGTARCRVGLRAHRRG